MFRFLHPRHLLDAFKQYTPLVPRGYKPRWSDGAAVEPLTVPQCMAPDADTAEEQGSAYASNYF